MNQIEDFSKSILSNEAEEIPCEFCGVLGEYCECDWGDI
jgi:hypothetical protein